MKKIFAVIIVIIAAALVLMFYRNNEPIDPIKNINKEIADNIKIIDTIKTDNGIMIYSYGETNDAKKNVIYFVDEVERSFNSYRWLGGGGHVADFEPNNFMLSLQLLNEEQNITPTFFGIIKDPNVNKIEVSTDKEIITAEKYEVNDELFFVGHFDSNVANSGKFQITIIYEDGSVEVHTFTNDEIIRLQEGINLYLNRSDFN